MRDEVCVGGRGLDAVSAVQRCGPVALHLEARGPLAPAYLFGAVHGGALDRWAWPTSLG